MEDPELFIRPDGLPMAFMMSYKGVERQKVKQVVEERGGIVIEHPALLYRDYMVRLLVRGEVSLRREQDMFDYKYVLDCVKENLILPNMLDYRINSHLPSILQPYDPVNILLGYKRWKDIPEVDGEKVSDVEDDDFDNDRLGNDVASKRNVFKSVRFPYSKKNQQEIVNFLVKYSAYKLVKGNSIWQRMEESGLCKGSRTWQSMKEHFRKKIVPQIHSFCLSWRQVRRFRSVFGLDQEHQSDEEGVEEEVEEVEREVRKEKRPNSSPLVISDTDFDKTLSDNVVDDEPAENIIEQEEKEEEEIAEIEVIAMKRKRKLFTTNVSYLDPETEEEGSEFAVTPVKKRSDICDIVEMEENDEVMEVIQVDDLDTVVNSSQEALQGDKVDLNEAINIDYDSDLEQSNNLSNTENNTYNVSQPLIVTPNYNQTEDVFEVVDTIEKNVPSNNTFDSPSSVVLQKSLNHVETLDDIFNAEEVPLPKFNHPPAKRKSASNISVQLQPLAAQVVRPYASSLTLTITNMTDKLDRSTSPLKYRLTSPIKNMSTSPLKNRSVSPLKDRSTSPLKDMPISPLKYTKSVNVQLRKLVLHSPHSLCCPSINTVIGRIVRQGTGTAEVGDGSKERVEDNSDDIDGDCLIIDNDDTDAHDSVITEQTEFIKNDDNSAEVKAAEKENSDREFWYNSRFRQPYSRGEEEAVVNFFLRNGGYSLKGGNMVWQKMEEDWICPGRTWQSLRERFDKSIEKNLKLFGVSQEQLKEVDRNLKVSSKEVVEKENEDDHQVRGFRQNANYYTRVEDLNIIKFIAENKRFDDVGGNEVWQVMEERKVVEGRSWQSMKERFRKVIMKRILSYGLCGETVKRFRGLSGRKKQKRMA